MYRSIGYYSQKPLTLWLVGNGSTDHLEDIWASGIMGQTRSRVAHKVSSQSSQRYNSIYIAFRFSDMSRKSNRLPEADMVAFGQRQYVCVSREE